MERVYVERHGPGTVRAERMPEGVSISHPDGVVIGQPGDWLVTAPSGHRYTLHPAAFHLAYRRADDTDIYTVEQVGKPPVRTRLNPDGTPMRSAEIN